LKSLSYGRLWSHRDFNRLWFSDTVSQIGNQFTNLALPILAVLSLHAGAFEIGLLMALQTLFFPILGLFVGVWADRLRKRPIMVVCNFGRMVGLASIPLAFFLSALTLYQLYAVAAVNGIFTVFFEISYQSYLPVLIDREDLVEGNSKLQTSASGAQVVGPALAGFVYQLVGGAITIAVDAIGYLISGLSLISIRKREAKPESNSPTGHPDFLEEMKEGIRTVFDNPPLWRITACTATSNFGSAMVGAVFVIFLLNILSFSPVLIGLLGTVGAVGFLLGTLVTPVVTKRLGLGRAIAIPAGIMVINIATPLAIYGHAFLIVGAIGLITGIVLPIYNINQVSLRQTIVPDRVQGRMNATVRTINWGTMPVGAMIGGTLGSTVGVIGTILVGGGLQGAAVLWVVSKHVIRLKEMPKPDEAQGFR
jgi:predicted MFS family arabinose efflux permease